MSDVARPPGRRPAPSLRTVSQAAAATVAALTLVGIVVGVTAVTSLSEARADLVDQIDPATVEAAELQAAAFVQQTGLRGYALTGDPDFLAGFRSGGEEAARLLASLEDRADPLPAIAPDVAEVAVALERWQDDHAARVIASVDEGAADVGAVTVEADPFPTVRTALEDLRGALAVERVAARAELRSSARQLSLTLVFGAALLVAVVGTTWVALRRSVIRPPFATVEDARAIAAGRVDHPVAPVSGPAEFVELAAAVETMRVELLRHHHLHAVPAAPRRRRHPHPHPGGSPRMTDGERARPIEILLVEDDEGDVVLTTEALEASRRSSTTCTWPATARRPSASCAARTSTPTPPGPTSCSST